MGAGPALESEHCVGTLTNPTEPPGAGNPHARWDEGAPVDGSDAVGRALLYSRSAGRQCLPRGASPPFVAGAGVFIEPGTPG